MDTLTTKVSETLRLLLGANGKENSDWASALKNKIDEFPNAEDFRDAYIICIENDADFQALQYCYGVTLALNVLRHEPKAKIMMYGFLPLDFVRKQKPEIDLVLKHDNAHFMSAPFMGEDFRIVFQTKSQFVATDYPTSKEVQKNLGEVLHCFGYASDLDNPAGIPADRYERGMEYARRYFPDLVNATADEIITFLKAASTKRDEVMKGQRIEGVYCDVEGTILVEGKLNHPVLNLLAEYGDQGKHITIWTDGNIEEIGQTLKSLDVPYVVKSKFDYAGSTAEIVIDDQDEYSFTARTKISAEKFIRVSDIN